MKTYLKIAIFVVIGGISGYTYYHFWGCTNGCNITSNPLIITTYGAFMGLILGLPSKKKEKENNK